MEPLRDSSGSCNPGRSLGELAGLQETQALAVQLTGQPLEEIIAIAFHPDGSLGVAAHPGGKRVFSAGQVKDARKELKQTEAVLQPFLNPDPGPKDGVMDSGSGAIDDRAGGRGGHPRVNRGEAGPVRRARRPKDAPDT